MLKKIIGFKKEDYSFFIEERFRETICYIETNKQFVTYRLYIFLDAISYHNKYRVLFNFNNINLCATGVSINYSIRENDDILILPYRKTFEIYNLKKRESFFVDFDKGAISNHRRKEYAPVNIVDEECNKDINDKYLFYLNKYESCVKQIRNKNALRKELIYLLDISNSNEEDFVDIDRFFDLVINKERSFDYIKRNATFDNFKEKYPRAFALGFDNDFILGVLQEKIEEYCEDENSDCSFDEIIFNDFVNFEVELSELFNNVYEILLEKKKNIEEDKLREKYSIDEYIKFEKEYKEFIKKYNSNEIIIDLTKKENEILLSNNTSGLSTEEVKCADLYNLIITVFNEVVYAKNGGVKPTFKKLPVYINWAHSLFTWLKDNNIIAEDGSRFICENFKSIINMPQSLYNYEKFNAQNNK